MLGSLVPLAQEGSSGSSFLVVLVLMFALFYFLMIRPQQRRARAQRSLLESLDVGDEVLTIGGMFGTIQSVEDDSLIVEVAPEVEIRMLKSAIARKLSGTEDAEYEDEETDEEEDVAQEEEEGAGEQK